jgi:hypothetical protein
MIMRKAEALFAKAASGVKIVPVVLTAANEPARVYEHHQRECCKKANPPDTLLPSAGTQNLIPHRRSLDVNVTIFWL